MYERVIISDQGRRTVGIIGGSAYGGRSSDPVIIHGLIGIHDHAVTLARGYIDVVTSQSLMVNSVYFNNLSTALGFVLNLSFERTVSE